MYDMAIGLQLNSDKCLYEQIYEHIRQEIWEGKVLAGERLPSTRSLADYLQVSRSTVDYAYEQLLGEGYIESRPYKGHFVCAIEDLVGPQERMRQMEREGAAEGLLTGAVGEDGADVWDMRDGEQAFKSCAYDFAPHGIDMSAFPFSVWKKLYKNCLNDGNDSLWYKGDCQGDYELRLTISRYLHSSRGVNCGPEQIVVGAGSDYLLMLLQKLLGENVRIAMENPTYMRIWRIFRSFAYQVMTVPMDHHGMIVEELEKCDAQVAYVMPAHQFPTGCVMPVGRRSKLLTWANRGANRYLIEDDYDSEFRYRGKPIPALQGMDENGKVIYMGTFSKAIAPSIRVSYMVLPRKLLEVYQQKYSFYSCTVSRIDQSVLNEFIREGYFDRHLNKMRKQYRTKHDLLLQELEPFRKKFVIRGEQGGLHLLLTAKWEVTEAELVERAYRAGVRVYGISDSCAEPVVGRRATVLLGFGALSEEAIVEGIEKLKEAWMG